MRPLIVITTVGDNFAARELANVLVERRLAACVNILPNLFSVYRWEEKVASEYEQLMVIKTSEERLGALKAELFARHPYQVPEFIVLPIETIAGKYAEWFSASLEQA